MDGANIVTEGFGSTVMTTEGYGYVPRAIGSVKPGIQQGLAERPMIAHLKEAVANTFTTLRVEFGSEISVETIWQAIDQAILAQPDVYKKPNFEGMSPALLAQLAYGGLR